MIVSRFVASTVLAAAAATSAEAADRYVIDAAHSTVQFSVERFGFNQIIGSFGDVSGAVVLDSDAPQKSAVEATIGAASLYSGDAERDGHVSGPRWLNAAANPSIVFKSTNVTLRGEHEATVTGSLTLLGVTRLVTLAVRLNKLGADPSNNKPAAGFSATAALKRSDFGLETALALIGDEVEIRLEILAHKEE